MRTLHSNVRRLIASTDKEPDSISMAGSKYIPLLRFRSAVNILKSARPDGKYGAAGTVNNSPSKVHRKMQRINSVCND